MNIIISSENKKDYLLIESKGTVETTEELLVHSQLVYEEIIRHDHTKILINDLETHFPLALSAYMDLVQSYIDNFPVDIKLLKIACVLTRQYKEVGSFWETICNNRGFHFFHFTSEEEALAWLAK